VACEIINFGCN